MRWISLWPNPKSVRACDCVNLVNIATLWCSLTSWASLCVQGSSLVSDRVMGAPVISTKPRRGTDCQCHSYNEGLMVVLYNYPARLEVCDQAWLYCIAYTDNHVVEVLFTVTSNWCSDLFWYLYTRSRYQDRCSLSWYGMELEEVWCPGRMFWGRTGQDFFFSPFGGLSFSLLTLGLTPFHGFMVLVLKGVNWTID